MEMTVDEAMKNFKRIHRYEKVNQFYAFSIESIDVAMDIMRKYQKIEEIITDWKSDGGAFEMSELYWLRLISEVLEDGNDERIKEVKS